MNKEKVLIGLAIGAALLFALVKKMQGADNETAYGPLADSYADAYGLDRALVRAIVKKESSWNPNGINRSDPSYGLIGVTTYIGVRFKALESEADPAQLYDPIKNLIAGCGFLKYLLDLYPLDDSIEMYNEGEPNFWNGLHVPEYLAAVKGFYDEYKSL